MKTQDNASKILLTELQQLHDKNKHQEIVDQLQQLPETRESYSLVGLLARALNNLGRYEEALKLLLSVKEQGQDDKMWQFRVGYSLYYIDGREVESIAYFERAIELGDDFPATYELLLEAKSYLENDSTKGEAETVEFEFTPKAFAQLALKMRLQPKHRAHIEDSLDFMLRSKKWGCISGGGTLVSKEGEPEACDIEIDLVEYSETMQKNLLSIAEKLEVAEGSTLKYYSADKDVSDSKIDMTCSTGKLIGLGIYIKNTDIPEDENEGEGIGYIYNSLIETLSNNGALIPSYGENLNEVGMYYYGEGDYKSMLNKAITFLKNTAYNHKYRTIQIA